VNVASPTAAILESVDVAAGDRVVAGQAVARLNADVERYDVLRAEQAFEQHLVRRLAEPADRELEAAVAEARGALERARARVRERVLTAPRDGVVDDIRLVAGQPVEAGQTVISLGPEDGDLKLVCAIPASHRPALEAGQLLRFEPLGYPFSYQRVVVTSIGNRVFGPSELRAVFSREIGDTFEVDGPVVVVEAAMTGRSFAFDGVDYTFHPGMLGRADIRLADDPALFVLFPFLSRLL
jgi:multidrug efflux pump subunit AcrA (membrane-fusion protein)